MRSQQVLQPYLVGFERIELVATMCALVHFAHYSRTFSESIELNLLSAYQPSAEKAKCFIDIAETLIIRLQDAMDEDQISLLCREDCVTPMQAGEGLRSVCTQAGKVHSEVREASRSPH